MRVKNEKYNPEVHGRYHMHMGMVMDDVQRLIDFIDGNQLGHRVYVDGDGWTHWGEAVDDNPNDGVTRHVIIPVKSPRAGQRVLADLLDFRFGHERFVPQVRGNGFPKDAVDVIAIISDGEDWAEDRHHLSWEYGLVGESIPSGVVFSMWPPGRKAYHLEISPEDGAALENWLFSTSAEIVDVVDVESGEKR